MARRRNDAGAADRDQCPALPGPTGMMFSRENILALLLCLLAILLIIVASDAAPQWIYQGF